MDEFDVRRLGLILAIQAEIEGMKAENKQRDQLGHSMAYTYGDFCEKAEEMREITYRANHQL